MLRVVNERYPPDDWNIYAAQASDGHNFDDDMERCVTMLEREILPICQYFAYIEVMPEAQIAPMQSVAWAGYSEIAGSHPHFAMRRVSSPSEIYPVFRELFSGSSSGSEERIAR